MSRRLQGIIPIPFPGGGKAPPAENSKELLQQCLQTVHDHSRCYFYCVSAEESIPGSLSYLLFIGEAELVEIFKICGFYNDNIGVFRLAAFRTWIAATFEAGTVEVATLEGNHSSRLVLAITPDGLLIKSKKSLASQGSVWRLREE
jgi:hypothetical protein